MTKVEGSRNETRNRREFTLRLMKAINLILILIPFAVGWIFFYSPLFFQVRAASKCLPIFTVFIFLYVYFGRVYDAFLLSLRLPGDIHRSQILALITADGLMMLMFIFFGDHFPNLIPAFFVYLVQIFFSGIWCVVTDAYWRRHFKPRKTGVVYDMRPGLEHLFHKYQINDHFNVQKVLTVQECLNQDMDALKPLDCVFLSGVRSLERNQILKYCLYNDIEAYVIPRIGDSIMSSGRHVHLFHLPVLQIARHSPSLGFYVAKRLFDPISSSIALVLLSPLMAIVAAVIKLQDGGPVLYRQKRLTKDGRVFTLLKFRSMRVDAEKDGVARLSSGEGDARITPVGRFTRKYRIDELPQLFNIIEGSMSVVGPRPERPEISAQYEEEFPEFSLRLQVKAGLTGYAQVFGKYNTHPYDKLQLDLTYIANASFLYDLNIIFATVQALLKKESTEGIEEGATNALNDVIDASISETKVEQGMKKVLIVATVVKTHLMQFHIPYLKLFKEKGWETWVASRNDYENPADCVIPYCDYYYDTPFERNPFKPGNIKAYKALKKLIDEGDFDIIHCHTPVGGVLARLAARDARKKGTKVFYTAHGFHFYKGASLMSWMIFYPIERWLSRYTDVLITINKEDYKRAKTFKALKTVYVPGVGIDLEKFKVRAFDRSAKRRSLGVKDEDFVILTVAELIPRKNYPLILESLALLKRQGQLDGVRYLICGRGTSDQKLKELVDRWNLTEEVVFLGYRNDVPEICNVSDLFVFMPLQEGLPVVLMEAMACGLPIVCSKIRGNTDLIKDGVTGVLSESESEALSKAILRIKTNPQLRRQLASNGLDRVKSYELNNVLSQVGDLYGI